MSDAFQAAFLIYDRNDALIFASRSVSTFLPCHPNISNAEIACATCSAQPMIWVCVPANPTWRSQS